MRYFVHTKETVDFMLNTINRSSLDELFSSIPKQACRTDDLALPRKLDERTLKQELLRRFSSKPLVNFIGAGATAHFAPEWISQQLMRAEWYTSYTPYQPEASQGTLQAIFEFQTMVASLFGLEVANASMYDGATALMEAILMAMRSTGKKTVILSSTIHPEYRATVKTYLRFIDATCLEVGFDQTGLLDHAQLTKLAHEHGHDLAAVAVQSPNFFGRIEQVSAVSTIAKRHKALLIGCVTELGASALLPSFGALGADIAVGDGLGFLGSISFGGPGVGLFACKRSLLRQMPGRLVGATTDREGNLGYVLTLSTREQHIRREKATSNICTNHNLMALALSMNLASYGKSGLIDLAKTNLKKTLYFRSRLQAYGKQPAFLGPHFNETVVNVGPSLKQKLAALAQKNMVGGLPLKQFFTELDGHVMVSCTELHDDTAIDYLAKTLCGENS